MKKHVLDLKVVENVRFHDRYCLLKLTSDKRLPEMLPGQFVQVKVTGSEKTFLRRPISINYVNKERNELWLLIQIVGPGTQKMAQYVSGDIVNTIVPLGNGFTVPQSVTDLKILLVGGGVGTAPILFMGKILKEMYFNLVFLLGGRTKNDIMQMDEFQKLGTVYVTTEDGSKGEKGFVTNHSTLLVSREFGKIYACGPKPMMEAVAKYAKDRNIDCEVSLENMMACGIGACLCCVEKTVKGNVCVCTEGPVFNINQLTWQI
ncbi:MAG: dihydroorotate dehydrogenase electron transfer subunit [Tannerella sp.]|nr:dihydroorotate dehydrogenase electron transfer subunit [Tannerella sp.]